MELFRHVTLTQYLQINNNKVLSCDVEPASTPDTKSRVVFHLCYFRAKRRFCQVIIGFWRQVTSTFYILRYYSLSSQGR